MDTASVKPAPHSAGWSLVVAILLGLSLVVLGCDEDPEVTTVDRCDKYLDAGEWNKAIAACSQVENDEGYGKTAQAYMGRAGIGLLALLEKIGDSNQEGLALMLSAFSVNPVQFLDVQAAIDSLLRIKKHTTTDAFNLIVSTDVAISTLLQNELDITVDSTSGAMTIPGITDSGLDQLSATSTPTAIQTAMEAIYAATYYQTAPPIWSHANPAILDLKSISTFVQANALGASLVELGDLSDLDFSASIDNGRCGLAAAQTASGIDNVSDGPQVAQYYPRRLNTSNAAGDNMADDLQFVLLDGSATVDNTREWKGTFRLPSRLLNPDFLAVNCGGGLAIGNFSICMAAPAKTSASFTEVRVTAGATQMQCGAGNCAGSATAGFPVTSADGNPLTDDGATERTDSMTHLAQALHQLYPVDNAAASPGTSGLHCMAGDGWVHAREYDYYLRTLGQ